MVRTVLQEAKVEYTRVMQPILIVMKLTFQSKRRSSLSSYQALLSNFDD